MSTDTDTLARLIAGLDESLPAARVLDAYSAGRQPLAFLSPESRTALGGRLPLLAVNFPDLVVRSLAERLTVTGFRLAGPDSQPDADVWRIWLANRLGVGSAQAHREALALGRCPVMVWAGRNASTPRVSVESPRQVWTERDPETGEITAAVKVWADPVARKTFATLYSAQRVTRYTHSGADPVILPRDGWSTLDEVPNPLGVVPVVDLVNTARLLDFRGRSEMHDILTLTDAINKVLADAMVTSEAYARPRRWVSGLEPTLDDDGNPIHPFGSELEKLWHAESPDTQFGEFSQATMTSYTALISVLTQQISALSNLPPHYLGILFSNPASADAIRSAEASLVARAIDRQRVFGSAWEDVVRLVAATRDGTDPEAVAVETVWANPETRTPAQSADAAAKLSGIGVPLQTILSDTLGMTPAQVDATMTAKRAEMLVGAGANLSALAQQ